MQIDPELMKQFDTGLTAMSRAVPLGDTGVFARVMPASFVQLTDAVTMLAEYVDIEQTAREFVAGKMDDAELISRIASLVADAPAIRDKWIELMQPHCNVDLGRLTAFMFASVAVEFLVSSFDAGSGGWKKLGNRLAPLKGAMPGAA